MCKAEKQTLIIASLKGGRRSATRTLHRRTRTSVAIMDPEISVRTSGEYGRVQPITRTAGCVFMWPRRMPNIFEPSAGWALGF